MFAAILISLVVGLAGGGFAGYTYGAKALAETKAEITKLYGEARTIPHVAANSVAMKLKALAEKL
jgi:hypothetical protein